MVALLCRQRNYLLALIFLLASCGGSPQQTGGIRAFENFTGVAISEEPRAALAARDILSAGGSAADAAVMAFFVMTVTYPVAVGLGGGGICLYYDHQLNKTETLDFRVNKAKAGGRIAIPGTLRGMALLHSRYGRLPWSKLVAPAETMARFGHQVSRALAKRLGLQINRLSADQSARQIFLRGKNYALNESETIVQVELASVLSRIRTRGVGDLYGGEGGHRLVEAASRLGGKLSIRDLREYRAVWRGTIQIPVGNHVLHYPSLGKVNDNDKEMIALLTEGFSKKYPALRKSRAKIIDSEIDKGQAGLVVADKLGSAVACLFDMGNAFGVSSMESESGIFLAPTNKARGGLVLLGINEHLSQTVMAVAGSGGADGAFAAAVLAVDVMKKGHGLANAMARQGVGKARVQGLWCPKGIRTTLKSCHFATDPQWHGLAAFDKF